MQIVSWILIIPIGISLITSLVVISKGPPAIAKSEGEWYFIMFFFQAIKVGLIILLWSISH